jgi:hypothetical protein
MNRLSTIAICGFMLLTAACSKEKTAIEYPAEGIYGPNILAEGRTSYPREVQMEADLGEENTIKIQITGVSGYLRYDTTYGPTTNEPFVSTKRIGAWWYMMGTQHNLAVATFEDASFSQTFQSIENNGKILIGMKFDRGHTFRLDVFENGASQPIKTKIFEVE